MASLPSRERGLKCERRNKLNNSTTVAPFTGAWIEINVVLVDDLVSHRRSLHGSVD